MYNIKDIMNIKYIMKDYIIYYNNQLFYPIIIDINDYNMEGILARIILLDINVILEVCLNIKNIIKNNKNNNKNIIIKKIDSIKDSVISNINIKNNKLLIKETETNILKIFLEYHDNMDDKKAIYNKIINKSAKFQPILLEWININTKNNKFDVSKYQKNNFKKINHNPFVGIKIDSYIK